MKEIWKDIDGYNGIYQISNFGNLRSYHSSGKYKGVNYLKPSKDQRGYLMMPLSKNNVSTTYRIHRLVAMAFIPNPFNKPQVNHIDGNKQNNNVDNLEWCTNQENQNHAVKHNLKARMCGNTNPRCRKINQYDLNNNFIKQWTSFYEIQKCLNIDRSLIWRCCIGKFKQAHNYIWKYAE